MNTYTKEIRERSAALLKEGRVDMVIGFKKGTLPMTSVPGIARTPQEAKDFVWDANCRLNLTGYLTNQKQKIGIIAKGCDARNIVTHIMENKISREQLYIIGVPCTGMVDKESIMALFENEITSFSEKGDFLQVTTATSDLSIDKTDYLRDNCRTCMHRNPVIYDELIAEPVTELAIESPFQDVEAIEALDTAQKWDHFDNLLNNCIRCYACRNACPLCYCPVCFVDASHPQWVGKGQDAVDVKTFHFLRAFHCAGRCTDCGACEEACPMNIKVRHFTRKLVKECVDIYGWEAGLSLDQRPLLDTFRPDDPDTFIK
ncbi:4Fe-4S ferredoxin [Desulfocicer niacini]